ncbi:MAG: fatty acid desaturase [Maricaulis sp.]|jgi:fatty acid desaturase|nr:fatty acid desaturase [Maricaulis sp.]HAQ34955.1 fatty acid desaturase [Alphaproteobacteria bacterium]
MTMKLSDALTREELRTLSKTENWRGALMLAGDFALIAAAFALAIWNPWLSVISILVLGGRQLALAIVMHDCAHHSLFRSRRLNDFVGTWIGGAAVGVPLRDYRPYHLDHHRHAGTDKDPDQGLVRDYPVSADSLRRKFIRDLTGQTGVKELIFLWTQSDWERRIPPIVFQLALLAALIVAQAPWALALWWTARIFVYPAIMRLRNIGEHGVALDRYDTEPRRNTHTTRANWLERLLVAPNHVHYHLEHHMFAAVPPYHLPRLHRLLSERGYYDGHDCISPGYPAVIRKAVRT